MASLYLHIPFCEHKCIYCDFYSLVPSESGQENRTLQKQFLFALENEIEICALDSRFQEPYETVFFGGGTPSLLHPSETEKILSLLASRFSIRKDAEVTLETNPGTVDKEKLREFKAAGVNRISMGIQSFHDEDLKFLTRIHTASEAKQCVLDCYKAGFENISFDLIFSLPNQTLAMWKSNLEQAIELEPQHISCYSLIIEPHTPLYRMVQSKEVAPIRDDLDAEMYEFTIDFLRSHGYDQYEISNFAKPNYRCRHNLNYWNHVQYIGFGPSAHSFMKNERWWNIFDVSGYINQLNENIIPVAEREQLTELQLIEETIFLGLRSEGIDLEKFHRRFSYDFYHKYESTIQELLRKGYARLENNRIRLTAKGYIVCDEICQSFR